MLADTPAPRASRAPGCPNRSLPHLEVHLNLAYRWFCRLGLEDKVPDHSSFSKNRHGRFRESDVLRHVFEGVVQRCMTEGLVRGEGFLRPISADTWIALHTTPPAVFNGSKRSGRNVGTCIRKPFARPLLTCTALSSPRFTRCKIVCRDTPSRFMALNIFT